MSDLNMDVEQLNSFLRSELSALEAYRHCIAKLRGAHGSDSLRALEQSHARRAELLRERILALGGQPSQRAGVWGGVLRITEEEAALFGPARAVAALEEGEGSGLVTYERNLPNLSPDVRQFIASVVLPEQHRAHAALLALRLPL